MYEESRAVAGRARGSVRGVFERVAETQKGQSLGRVVREVRRYCVGFTELQAVQLMKKTGGKVLIQGKDNLDLLEAGRFFCKEIKFSVEYFKHFFGQERRLLQYSSGAMRTVKSGGHWSGNKFLKLKNIVLETRDKAIDAVIRTAKKSGRIKLNFRKTTTPISWSIDTAVEKIMSSFHSIEKVEQNGGRFAIICLTDCGVRMKHITSLTGDLIATFFEV